MDRIKKHAVDNDYPIPTKEEVENHLCRRLSGEWCTGGSAHSFINTRFTMDDFRRGAQIAITGTLVDQKTAEERAMICSRCVANVSIPGCSACTGLANLVASLKGAKKTKYDHLLKVCGVCLCANEAQIWYEAEDLAKGVSPEMMETYREINESDGCWKFLALTGKTA